MDNDWNLIDYFFDQHENQWLAVLQNKKTNEKIQATAATREDLHKEILDYLL